VHIITILSTVTDGPPKETFWTGQIVFLIDQSIKTNLYSAISRVRIRGALWRRLCIMLLVSDVKQFSFRPMPKSAK